MSKDLPLKLELKLSSTNGTTMLKSLEAVCQMLKTFNFPKKGTKIENDYFEVEVLESTPGLS